MYIHMGNYGQLATPAQRMPIRTYINFVQNMYIMERRGKNTTGKKRTDDRHPAIQLFILAFTQNKMNWS